MQQTRHVTSSYNLRGLTDANGGGFIIKNTDKSSGTDRGRKTDFQMNSRKLLKSSQHSSQNPFDEMDYLSKNNQYV